jgi:hypothetical protein
MVVESFYFFLVSRLMYEVRVRFANSPGAKAIVLISGILILSLQKVRKQLVFPHREEIQTGVENELRSLHRG